MKDMNKMDAVRASDVIEQVFSSLFATRGKAIFSPQKAEGNAFAPTNIALCKYWGKRDPHLNLPMTNSLSVALPTHGSTVIILPVSYTHLTLPTIYSV